VSIFQNDSPKGAFKTATIQLCYKDKSIGEWKTGNSFGAKDLENLEKAAAEARKRITGKRPIPHSHPNPVEMKPRDGPVCAVTGLPQDSVRGSKCGISPRNTLPSMSLRFSS
jgi:hypothetical protein